MQTKSCLILAVALLLLGCKKDVSLKEERIQLLINKKWQLTSDAYYFRGDNGTLIANDNFGSIEYATDDYVIYHPDFTMEWNDNQVLDPNDSSTVYTGTWQIQMMPKYLRHNSYHLQFFLLIPGKFLALQRMNIKLQICDPALKQLWNISAPIQFYHK